MAGFELTGQLQQHSRVTTRLPERPPRVRARRLQGTAAAKKNAQHPRQHAVVVLQFVVDNTHSTALSSMLKGLVDSKLIEGYEKKPTGTSFGLSVEYVGLEKRTYLRKLGVVGGICHHPASPLLSGDGASISSSWKSSRSEYNVFTLEYRCD